MSERDRRWGLLGVGGLASLCCVGTSAVAGAAVTGGVVAGGLGAGLVQVLVTVLTVGVLGLAWRWRSGSGKREDGNCVGGQAGDDCRLD